MNSYFTKPVINDAFPDEIGFDLGRVSPENTIYNVVENPVRVRDLHATMLHLLGVNHEQLTFPFQGLDQRLTGVEKARVVSDILA